METKVRKRGVLEVLRGHLLAIVFFVMIFGFFIYGVNTAEKSSAAEGKNVLEENLHKAVVSCYALEGAYPSSVQYLEDNYGLTYDKDKYAIGYVAIGSNIMPDMQIIELGVEEDVSE
ncbi:MAG: hypothetical protein KBS43_05775 [Oscillospiraceae bacterium]|nr:hypothetical protein [Candidatus Limimonas coprohippi]MCQ2488056.1 hypothetical protein [Clostridia bacterium]